MASSSGGSIWRRLGRAAALTAGVSALTLAVASCGVAAPAEPAASPTQESTATAQESTAPETGKPPAVEPGWPRWGFTHTGVSANNVTREFEQSVSASLAQTPMVQNQHIMGFGALNPEPYPGQYFWEDLDSRLNLMKQSGATGVITLCCAPDWMKGGPEGPTEESAWAEHLEDAPYPEHFDDFAKLAAAVASRYKDVKYFMVWNEFKGFWKDHSKPADYKGYTQLYNKVYDAVKAARPDAKVGGPYLGFDSNKSGDSELRGDWGVVNQNVLDAFNYWFEHKKGADFVVVDGASVTDAHELLPDEFGALKKFGAVTKWLREKAGDLPVWWSEWYFVPEDGTTWPEPKRLAVQAASMIKFAESGAATALYWNPQAKEGACAACMWDPRSGAPLATGKLVSSFAKWFPAGAELEQVSSSDPKIRVLAQPQQLVMVNSSGSAVTATVDGKEVSLKPYEIKWSGR
ncbi:GH39 family glycosyl hydrolase [Nonomuraea zeae]|uniref:Xylan 1,4-beta-xylosidase n=1 Tax=Nonomuraea zeae TaxID=1642303 RepID=A0A5S4GBF7_9ACTN|nr:xylan 1,4-beta-xylosidase [Nonomuraea zeae]TMR29854.1 xylan 1,4-beta-xylosidase [Nonomuraea zeae]